MKKKIFISLLVVSFFNYVGCYSYESISYPEFEDKQKLGETPQELFINTNTLKRYHCSKDFLKVEEDSINIKGKIVIRNDYEEPFTGKIATENIKSIEFRNLDSVSTILLVGSIAGCVALLIFLISFGQSMEDLGP